MRVVCVCLCRYIWPSSFFMNETLCYNAVGIEQDMAWTKILGKLCVCVSTYDNLFFFMNETLCYNAVGIEQDMAWTKIFGKLCVCKTSTSANLFSLWTKHYAIMQ